MKRTFGIAALALFAFLLVVPQNAAAEIFFGFKGGISGAKLIGDDAGISLDWKNKISFSGGIFVSFGLGKYLAIQPELLYTMKGAKTNFTDEGIDYTGKLTQNFLEVPVLVKLRLPLGPVVPFVFAGPSVDAILAIESSGGGSNDEPFDLPSMDYGAIFGAGIELGRHLWLDVRISKGLKKLMETETGDKLDVRNSVMTASVSLAF